MATKYLQSQNFNINTQASPKDPTLVYRTFTLFRLLLFLLSGENRFPETSVEMVQINLSP